jgi:hypothetical protein
MVWFYEFRFNNGKTWMIACQEKAYVVVQMGNEDQNTISWSCQKSFDKQEYAHKASIAS